MRFYMFYKWQQSGHEVIEIFSTLQALQHDEMGDSLGFPDPDAPWCWYIYLHDWVIFGVNVGIHIPAPWVAYGRIASTSGTSLMIFFRHGFQNHIESSQVNFHELPAILLPKSSRGCGLPTGRQRVQILRGSWPRPAWLVGAVAPYPQTLGGAASRLGIVLWWV